MFTNKGKNAVIIVRGGPKVEVSTRLQDSNDLQCFKTHLIPMYTNIILPVGITNV